VALLFVAAEILQLSYVSPKLSRGFRELFQEGLDSEGLLVESLSGLRTIKLLAIEHYTRWSLESRLVRQLNTSFRTLKYATLANVASQLIGSLSAMAVLFYGAVLVLRHYEGYDDAATGPLHGFTGADDYYARSSSIDFLARVATPTLCLSAADDPFLPPPVLERVRSEASATLELDFTLRGGHVGFVGGGTPRRPSYWAEERMITWLAARAGGP